MTLYVDDAAILAVALVYIVNIVSVGFSDQQDVMEEPHLTGKTVLPLWFRCA